MNYNAYRLFYIKYIDNIMGEFTHYALFPHYIIGVIKFPEL